MRAGCKGNRGQALRSAQHLRPRPRRPRRRIPRPAPRRRPGAGRRGPAALRPFLAAALADGGTAPCSPSPPPAARPRTWAPPPADLLGRDAVAVLPSWETLPHERLSPRPDTVGRRLACCRRPRPPGRPPPRRGRRRRAQPAPAAAPGPGRPGAGRRCGVGDDADFDDLLRAARRAGLHPGRPGRERGEFAVRGGILDVFPPTERAPGPGRVLGRRGRGAPLVRGRRPALARRPVDGCWAPRCRELLLTDGCATGPRALGRRTRHPALREMLEQAGRGHRGRGHGVADPGPGRRARWSCSSTCCPPARRVLVADPERIRTRAADLVRTGQEFLEAQLVRPPARGRRRPDRPRRRPPSATSTRCSSTPRRPGTRWSR